MGVMRNKKGYYFSLDAFIALMLILGIVLFIKPSLSQTHYSPNLHEDLLVVLSNLQIGEINNSYVKQLIADGNITKLNQSVLEQIGEFYANSNPNADTLAKNILDDLNLRENIGLYFNNQEIATTGNLSFNDAETATTARQIISGIVNGTSATGFSSRAFLFSQNKVEYFYFGGYVGDGNITARFEGNIISAKFEGVFSKTFDLYINNQSAQTYFPNPSVPFSADLNNHLNKFVSGENLIEFKSGTGNIFIAGGFIKVVYDDVQNITSASIKKFPGVNGLINIYDSLYIPGNLTDVEAFLHYNSSYDIFFTIGNKTIYDGNSGGSEATITIPNQNFSSVLDYQEISRKTLPVRLGLKDVSLFGNLSDVFDIFSVTDLSSSMNAQTNVTDSNGNKLKIIDIVRLANKEFLAIILNGSITEDDNRVGLVGYNEQLFSGTYYSNYLPQNYHNLSINKTSLGTKIDDWTTKSGTCICCGIIKATEAFVQETNNPNKSKAMIVMSDGNANVGCYTNDPEQDAIDAACTAFNDYNIKVYAIGFGDQVDQLTMQAIASCGGGNYYFGNVGQLIDIYKQAAEDIIRAIYEEQTIISETVKSFLYPDSYISLKYQKTIPAGLIITAETPTFGNNISEGTFNVPNDSIPFEAGIISYSGSRWTDNLEVYNNALGIWERIFNLGAYNNTYSQLGDPYIVYSPSEKLVKGENKVRISTGLSPTNSTGGSIYNKAIYSVIKNLSAYTPIVASAEGCVWTIEFEDGTNSTLYIPTTYTGSNICSYTSSTISYNSNDAIQLSTIDLLTSLDLDSDGRIETKFDENDLSISSIEITGIPFTWETEVQVRVWR